MKEREEEEKKKKKRRKKEEKVAQQKNQLLPYKLIVKFFYQEICSVFSSKRSLLLFIF
jgi:hypothetical protein